MSRPSNAHESRAKTAAKRPTPLLVHAAPASGSAPGNAFTPENLFDARLQIVREAELANGKTRLMHDAFFADLSVREETHAGSQHC